MVRLDQTEIDTIRSHADIVDVISHYVSVEKSGKNYKCICPFHDDHDPSLSISEDLQIYKCFVCGSGGNVFTFVQNYEKVSFVEAVERVCELTGQKLSVQPVSVSKPVDPHIDSLHKILDETIRFTSYQLDTSAGTIAKEYLKKRGLDQSVIENFGIGFNPSGNVLSKFLKAKGYVEKNLVEANVSLVTQQGLMDVFSDRITFPIHDANGNPIGFSARSMNPDNPSKYINTNETELFKKGNIVYNYHRARSSARHNGRIYICEGVTDVIAFYRAGLTNAVCTLGTSCTSAQISLLKRAAARLVFCYDGDHAGQAATYRAGKMALNEGCEISIVLNRTGKDPDEIIASDGSEGLRNLVSHEISWMEFVLSYLSSETNMESYLDKKKMADTAMMEINQLKDRTEKEYFTRQLSEMTGFHLTADYSDHVPQAVEKPRGLTEIPNGLERAEEQILAMMFTSNEAVRKFEEEIGYLVSKDAQTLAMMIVDEVHSRGKCDPASLMDKTEDSTIRDRIARILSNPEWMNEYDASRMDGAIRAVKIRLLDDEASQYRDQLTQALNGTSMQVLMQKYNECLKERRQLIEQGIEERNE